MAGVNDLAATNDDGAVLDRFGAVTGRDSHAGDGNVLRDGRTGGEREQARDDA